MSGVFCCWLGVGLFHAVSMTVMMVCPAACSVSFVAYLIAQLRLLLLFMVCAFLFLVSCLCLFGVSAPRAGLLGGGVAACAPAYGGGEAGAVCAGSVVVSQGGGGCVWLPSTVTKMVYASCLSW